MSGEPRPTMTTYRMADGTLVAGEFSFVTGTEFFDESDEPCEVVRETWRLVESEQVVFNASTVCPTCEGEGETLDDGSECPSCKGSGGTG